MGDLISRQAAIDAFYRATADGDKAEFCEIVLRSIPSAQQERKTGKWCKSYADHEAFGVRPFFRYCSCCNEITVHPYKYCPHCGAMMEENDGN